MVRQHGYTWDLRHCYTSSKIPYDTFDKKMHQLRTSATKQEQEIGIAPGVTIGQPTRGTRQRPKLAHLLLLWLRENILTMNFNLKN